MGKRSRKSPAQEARGKLLRRLRSTQSGQSNLWLTICPWTNEPLAIETDPRIEHFYAVIGDPAVRSVCFNPTIPHISAEVPPSKNLRFDALVERLDGSSELHTVCSSAPAVSTENRDFRELIANQNGAVHRYITLKQLSALDVRIWNWRRGCRFVRAAAHTPHEDVVASVSAYLDRVNRATIKDISDQFSATPLGILASATVQLLLRRAFCSDLDNELLSFRTQLYRGDQP